MSACQRLGTLARDRDPDAAEGWYRHALVVAEEAGDNAGLATSWMLLAWLQLDRDHMDAAIASAAAAHAVQLAPDSPRLEGLDRLVAHIRSRVGSSSFDAIWRQLTGRPGDERLHSKASEAGRENA